MPINIIIADDDALIRESLKIIFFDLDERFHVVNVAKNGKEAYDICKKEAVDVALLDVRMPILNGVEATAKKIVSDTMVKVLILTTFDEDDYIKNAFLNGASGYLLKNNPPEQIKNAVIAVQGGGNAVVQDVVMEKIKKNPTSRNNKEDKLKELTTREKKEIVTLIAKGLTNKEIANQLFISEGTVKNTVSNVLSKLALKHRTQIAIYYLED